MTDTRAFLGRLMERYTTASLLTVDPPAFRERIDDFLGLIDPAMEGYDEAAVQRDLSIRFHWGHDHDFGEFRLAGRMGDRHLTLLATFVDEFGALPRDLRGKTVLDIGCWTGGTSLLLCAMGAHVVAIEEVKKYADALAFLRDAFGLDGLDVQRRSLYELDDPAYYDRFDYVLFAGVLYHLTDPVLGTRIAYNALKDGGVMLVETMAVPGGGRTMEYWGPGDVGEGSAADLNRGGWNWFVPSPAVLGTMLRDAGLVDVVTGPYLESARAFAVARRDHHRDINRAGLSVPRIR